MVVQALAIGIELRNAQWLRSDLSDYTCSPSELSEWLPKIKKLDKIAEKAKVLANNHWCGQAFGTIRQLRMMPG